MVEVDTLDAVGQALDRVGKDGFSVSSTLGRHTNDKMVSFYVRAPGGWDIEFGTEGMLVDEKHYTAEEITADSYWGHDWSGTSRWPRCSHLSSRAVPPVAYAARVRGPRGRARAVSRPN